MSSGPNDPVRVRRDPRAEPDEPDPVRERNAENESESPAAESSGAIRLREDQVSLPSGRPPMNALRNAGELEAAMPAEIEILEAKKRPVTARGVSNVDPRLAEIEPLISRGDWAAVAKRLGPFDKAGALPPQLGVMYAIAVNEVPADPTAEGEDATALAIRCVAAMCGVGESSNFALIIAKRLLRKNPTSFRTKQAPPAKTSFLIVLVVLILGGALGYVLSSGKIHFPR